MDARQTDVCQLNISLSPCGGESSHQGAEFKQCIFLFYLYCNEGASSLPPAVHFWWVFHMVAAKYFGIFPTVTIGSVGGTVWE